MKLSNKFPITPIIFIDYRRFPMNFKEWVGSGILCGIWDCGERIVVVLIEAALGIVSKRKTCQASGRNLGRVVPLLARDS